MEFALNDDQVSLQQVLRDFFTAQSPEAAVRALMDDPVGFDRPLWNRMAAEMGLQGMAVPEAYGGGGFGFVELGLVLEEMGRALFVSPFLASCVMAAQLLLALDDEDARKRLLPGIADGTTIATVALAEDSGSWELPNVATTAVQVGDHWRIDGHKSFVLDGVTADVLLVVARVADGVGVFEVPSDAPGLARTPLPTMDQTRKLARLSFEASPAQLLGTPPAAIGAVTKMLDRTAVALAAESLGGMDSVLQTSVEYAKEREQFGRPIGSFQAIKHKCATMLIDLESARSAVYYALWAVTTDDPEEPLVAPLVKAHCADAYVRAAGENVQVHGGIGFTWEASPHLYLKRAKSSQVLLGGSDLHRQLLADRLHI